MYLTAFLVLLVVTTLLIIGRKVVRPTYPYKRNPHLMTDAEISFYRVLKTAVKDKYLIFPQIGLGKILMVDDKHESEQRYKNRINQKSVDFVLVDPKTMDTVLVVELDDNTHYYPSRVERDIFVNQSLDAAGVSFLRIKNKYYYNPSELDRVIKEKLDKNLVGDVKIT